MSNDREFQTLQTIVDQLLSCDYTCEAGGLKNNRAFIALEEMADRAETVQESMMDTGMWFVFDGEKYSIEEAIANQIAKTVNRDLVWFGGVVWRFTLKDAAHLPIYPFEDIRFQTVSGDGTTREHSGLVLYAYPEYGGKLELFIVCPKDRRLVVEPF